MEDLISQLPDELLQVILLNVSTRDSVRTSVLSSRWRYLWKGVPGLNLTGDVFTNIHVKEFLERFLNRHDKSSPIHKFTLKCKEKYYNYVPLKWLIGKVIARGVQCIAIDGFVFYAGYRKMNLPISLFKCETLVHLWLNTVTLNDCKFINLPRLETMHLDSVSFDSKVVLEELILCSPALQALSIQHTKLEHLTLRSETVKRLSLYFCNVGNLGVVIDIPSLAFLCIKNDWLEKFRFKLESVSSSINMRIDVVWADYNMATQRFCNFFAGFCSRVTDLTLGVKSLVGVYRYDCEPQQLPIFDNLSHLNACFLSEFSELTSLPMLLSSCPNLKSLDLRLAGYPNVKKIASLLVPRCFLTSLECVNVQMIPRSTSEELRQKAGVEFAEYILKNARVLKKFTLWLDGEYDDSSSVLQRILAVPTRAVVELKMDQNPAKFSKWLS